MVRYAQKHSLKHLVISVIALVHAMSAEAQFAEFNDRGVTFGHMHLVVEDISLHKRLWPEIIWCQMGREQGYTAVWISNALIFFRNAEPTAPSAHTTVDHFGLTVRDLEAVLSKWRALGYGVDLEATDASGESVTYITMPGGIRLALQEDTGQSAQTAMGHVHFVSSPVRSELMNWYSDYFGAMGADEGTSDDAAEIPGSLLRFDESETKRLSTETTAIDHIGFEIDDWSTFIETLEDRDVEFNFGPVYIESLDLWVAFFEDPSGVLVEISNGLDRF